MSRIRIIGIVLIIAGLFGVVYDRITYTRESHGFEIGSLEVEVKERETVNIPLWGSVGAIAVGAILILSRRAG